MIIFDSNFNMCLYRVYQGFVQALLTRHVGLILDLSQFLPLLQQSLIILYHFKTNLKINILAYFTKVKSKSQIHWVVAKLKLKLIRVRP